MKKLSIIIPTLNEENAIGKIIRECKSLPITKEVIIVDGNSKDRTVEIAKKLGAKAILESRKGYGRAYKTGFKNAKGEYIATMDGDGTYSPQDIFKLFKIARVKENVFISGNRLENLKKGSMPFINIFGNKLISSISNLLFDAYIEDTQSGMWIFPRKLLKKFKLRKNGMNLSSEIKLEAHKKSKFIEKQISYKPRLGKKSMNALKQGFEVLNFLFKRAIYIRLSKFLENINHLQKD